MANDIPDYMRGFDINEDWGFTAVPDKPSDTPSIDPEKIDTTNVEVAKVKQGVDDVKSMMNEIMNIVAENKQKAETELSEDIEDRFKANYEYKKLKKTFPNAIIIPEKIKIN